MKKIVCLFLFIEVTFLANAQNIGFGTQTPGAKLHIVSAGDEAVRLDAASPYLSLYSSGVYKGYFWKGPNSIELGSATGSNLPITLAPNGVPRFYMGINGNVGIGIPNSNYQLDVSGSSSRTGNFVNTGTNFSDCGIYSSCNTIPYFGTGIIGEGGHSGVEGIATLPGTGDRNGLIGNGFNGTGINIGVSGNAFGGAMACGIYGSASGSPDSWGGYFGGSVYSTGTYQGSDRKLKNDIEPLRNALVIIQQLNPSVYTYKTHEFQQMHLPEGLHYGLIADEVLQVIPGAIKKTVQPAQFENHNKRSGKKLSDEVVFDAVNYTEMIPILIAAVKEQQLLINSQQKQIDELKKVVDKLLIKENN